MIEFGEIILGLVCGHAVISLTESLCHKNLLHATKQRVNSWRRLGWLGRYIHSSWYSHYVIHHYKIFTKNHVIQFSSHDEEKILKQWLTVKGKEQVIRDGYGVRIGGLYQKIQYVYTHILQLLLISYFGGAWFTIGVIFILLIYVWMAEYVHAYIHQSYDISIDVASLPMKIFIKSNYFKYLSRHHFIHHKYNDCNFNLMLGGDYLLGLCRPPSQEDLLEMKKIGLRC